MIELFSLRSAFRYSYFAFLLALAGLVVIALDTGLDGQAVDFIKSHADIGIVDLVATMGLALIVPLFLAFWLLVGGVILRLAPGKASLPRA